MRSLILAYAVLCLGAIGAVAPTARAQRLPVPLLHPTSAIVVVTPSIPALHRDSQAAIDQPPAKPNLTSASPSDDALKTMLVSGAVAGAIIGAIAGTARALDRCDGCSSHVAAIPLYAAGGAVLGVGVGSMLFLVAKVSDTFRPRRLDSGARRGV